MSPAPQAQPPCRPMTAYQEPPKVSRPPLSCCDVFRRRVVVERVAVVGDLLGAVRARRRRERAAVDAVCPFGEEPSAAAKWLRSRRNRCSSRSVGLEEVERPAALVDEDLPELEPATFTSLSRRRCWSSTWNCRSRRQDDRPRDHGQHHKRLMREYAAAGGFSTRSARTGRGPASRSRPPRNVSSMMKHAPTTTPPSCSTRPLIASTVPPVASTSSWMTTRAPGGIRSGCSSSEFSPYSRT